MLFILNLILAVFNLLPVPPLDGSGAVLLFLRKDQVAAYQNLLQHPLVSVLGLLVAWYLFSPLLRPVFMLLCTCSISEPRRLHQPPAGAAAHDVDTR